MKTKQQRIDWFNSLTGQEKEEFYNRRKTRKRKYQPNKYPEPITAKNALFWRNRILRENPWLNDLFVPRINSLDYQHLQSITAKDRTKIA